MKEFPDSILLSKDSESEEILDYWILEDKTHNINKKYYREDIVEVAKDHAYMAGADWQSKQDEIFIEHVELSAYSNGFKDAIDKTIEYLYKQLNEGDMQCNNITKFIEDLKNLI